MELKETGLGFTKSFKADWLHLTGRNVSRFSTEGGKGMWTGLHKQTFETAAQVQTIPLIKTLALETPGFHLISSHPRSLRSDKVMKKQSLIRRFPWKRTRDREGRVRGIPECPSVHHGLITDPPTPLQDQQD